MVGAPASPFAADPGFTDSVARLYATNLVPLIFEPYAADLARRVGSKGASRILETAAGTGVVTRAMAATLPRHVSIVATDLSTSMLSQASETGTRWPVEWRQADAQQLPFPDESFDAVVCQFGAMFFPDKPKAFREARRVLRPGGWFIFNVWDRIEENEFAHTVTNALQELFPQDPPRFLARLPHGYADVASIRRDLVAGGFSDSAEVSILSARSRADSPRAPALAYCQGTPLRNEIETRGGSLHDATEAATLAIARKFGDGPVDGKIQAKILAVEKSKP